MKKIVLLSLLIIVSAPLFSQCNGRYDSEIFTSVSKTTVNSPNEEVTFTVETSDFYKSSLNYMPFVGSYARWLGCVPVNRGRRGEAIRNMVTAVTSSFAPPGQLIIYPQGTRVAPGVRAPFKVGIAALYIETGQACVPAATNVGVFWPRRAVYRKPGLAVVEFLPSIPSSLDKAVFMQRVQESVEENSNRLMLEAGFQIPPNV